MGFFDALKISFGWKGSDKKGSVANGPTYVTVGGQKIVLNERTAMTLSAVFNALDIISNDIAVLPKSVFKKTDKGRVAVPDHPVDYLIHSRPNEKMTSFSFHKALVLSALFRGNGIAIIERNRLGDVLSLQLVTDPVLVYEYDGELFYEINEKMYAANEILHIPGFSFNGITGKGVIEYAAESLGVPLNAQYFATDYYSGKAQGIGIVESEKFISGPQKKKIESGISNSLNDISKWRVPVLDDGMKFKQIKLTAEEIKFIDTFKFSVEEVARWFNIPVVKLKNLDNASYNNVENLAIMHINDSILPWAVKFEQEYNVKLFNEQEIRKDRMYVKFNINVLLRADLKSRAEYYSKAAFTGWVTRNEIRALEEMNSIDGLDVPLTPVNTQTKEQIDMKMKLDESKIKQIENK